MPRSRNLEPLEKLLTRNLSLRKFDNSFNQHYDHMEQRLQMYRNDHMDRYFRENDQYDLPVHIVRLIHKYNRLLDVLYDDDLLEYIKSPYHTSYPSRGTTGSSMTLTFLDEKSGPRSYFVELNGDKCSVPYAKLVLLLYLVIKLKKDGTGWINTELADKEGIIEADNDINHFYRLISELTKCLKQCNNLIQNDGAGNYRLNIPLRNISYPSDKWLNNTYGDILSSLDMVREQRKKHNKQFRKMSNHGTF